MTPMHSPDAPGIGLRTIDLTYHAKNLRFLDGARYQGSTFEGEVDVTIEVAPAPTGCRA